MRGWIDVHAHLDDLAVPREEALKACTSAGISHVITISTGTHDLPKVLEISAEKVAESPKVFCTLGYHPHEAAKFTDADFDFIKSNCTDSKVVAIGEIGLDYYYNHSAADVQKQTFRKLMDLAAQKKMPVQIHTRDAEQDTVEILKEYKGRVTGILHCFSGTSWLADAGLDLGYNLSISGILTFKNAGDLRDIVTRAPMDRLHIETDSPYLAPIPFRGQKNQPAYVVKTAELMAQLKGLTLSELSDRLYENTMKMFPKMLQ
jgi:TatD DNase family protein